MSKIIKDGTITIKPNTQIMVEGFTVNGSSEFLLKEVLTRVALAGRRAQRDLLRLGWAIE